MAMPFLPVVLHIPCLKYLYRMTAEVKWHVVEDVLVVGPDFLRDPCWQASFAWWGSNLLGDLFSRIVETINFHIITP